MDNEPKKENRSDTGDGYTKCRTERFAFQENENVEYETCDFLSKSAKERKRSIYASDFLHSGKRCKRYLLLLGYSILNMLAACILVLYILIMFPGIGIPCEKCSNSTTKSALQVVTGAQGVKDPELNVGLPGPKGQKGEIGHNGLPGMQGQSGLPGFSGAIGPTGPKGQKGEDGKIGIPGLPGQSGLPGFSGAIGSTGPKGQKGEDGKIGIPGVPGLPGISTSNTNLVTDVQTLQKFLKLYCMEFMDILLHFNNNIEMQNLCKKILDGSIWKIRIEN